MSTPTSPDRFEESKDRTPQEASYREGLEAFFGNSLGSNVEKLKNFAKYVPRQSLTRFLARTELFRQVLEVQGSIVECGVLYGGGLMSFAQLSAILEPVNYQRRIIGFDTFAGFAELDAADATGQSEHLHPGGMAVDAESDLEEAIRLFDMNRNLSHVPKVSLVRGDASQTIPAYLEQHPHTVVSLLYLDMDVYEPTRVALEHLLPRIPRGGIVAFDELNSPNFPGETVALIDSLGIGKLRLRRFAYDSYLSYAVLE